METQNGYDVVALGGLLIDFTDNGKSAQGNNLFEANPGGAPCNVLAMLSRLGRRTAFIGKVGDDFLGHYLAEAVRETGIDVQALRYDADVHTTLAFVHTFADGDRDFSFYRNPGADVMLKESEVPARMVQNTKVFHFGSLSLTHENARNATKYAVSMAQEAGEVISFDPNLREPLWRSLAEAKEQIAYGLSVCDILKISDNEIQWFTGEEDYDAGIAFLQEKYRIPVITLSLGKKGSRMYIGAKRVEAEPFLLEDTIETTGAGDTFCACILHGMLEHAEECGRQMQKHSAGEVKESAEGNASGHSYVQMSEREKWEVCCKTMSQERMRQLLDFANAAAALVTTRKGALKVMPQRAQVEELMRKKRTL